jgi:putative ABC transport system permease protein
MIPIKYNIRNLRARWVSTLMTTLGTALVVWSSCILFGLVEGLQHSFKVSGDPLGMIVLRKGSTSEISGGFTTATADKISTLSGIARDPEVGPLFAKEMLNIPIAERLDGSRTNIIIRGVSPASPKLRPKFTILPGGRYFKSGTDECIVSKNLSRRFKNATVGSMLRFGEKEAYRVVGVFTAGGSSAESEVWLDLGDMERILNRQGYVSCVRLRTESAKVLDDLTRTLDTDPQFKLRGVSEPAFFSAQSQSSLFLKGAGTLIAVLLTIGAMFAAANTMYAAVSARTREIGTLRALGFSRTDILASFLGESVLLCAMGGALGLLATIPLSALTYGTSNFNTFSEVVFSFRFGPLVMIVAVLMTLAMGVFGGLFPAMRAVRMDVISALREL